MPGTEVFNAIDEASTNEELLDLLSTFFAAHGFEAICYVLPQKGDIDHYQLFERGLPRPWMDRYEALDFADIDPIPDFVMKHGEVMTLATVVAELEQHEEHAVFFAEFASSGIENALIIPTYGRKRAKGIFAISQSSEETLAEIDRSLMHAVAQHAHWKFDQMSLDREVAATQLSPRELEILTWLSAGKSNPDIATILGISMPTVATHLKRLFAKLEVNDRVSAAVKGYKLGLLEEE